MGDSSGCGPEARERAGKLKMGAEKGGVYDKGDSRRLVQLSQLLCQAPTRDQ